MVTKNIPINHNILEWARKDANLSPSRAVIKARIKDLKARGGKESLSSILRLEKWEKGIEIPTFPQLENLAKAYRRPVLTFFLTEPPAKETRLKDFRTIGNKSLDSDAFSSEFSALLRQTEALQISVHDLLEDSGIKPLSFVGSATTHMPTVRVAQAIRNTLKYPLDVQKRARADQVFSDIRNRAEEQGIFVLLQGNLGSWHTDIVPEVFRGIAFSDQLAPFIVVNPNDAKAAMIFTLIHELCHIWLGDTGISNLSNLDIHSKSEFENELFCNQVAAEFLVPQDDLVREWNKPHFKSITTSIEHVSDLFSVSRIVIARRILDLGYIDEKFYWDYFNECQIEWKKLKDILRSKKTKVPYKIRTRSRLGGRLINTVISAAREGRISELDASRMLNVKINNFSNIV
jgi:Zn-dependent peptidase ImmA (M78 family)/transcriptional regulator with XRE-family HTH domain